ncbi:MAG: Gfo/Idh/MocA family oxidoreductase [Pirellulaceae bacterium]|nr:Gfo/Idh/MocA family oxidoreductase [Pirellulaceae bacterium]
MSKHTRRDVLRTAVMSGVWLAGRGLRAAGISANEKLNVAFIGVGGRGEANLDALQGENVVALCDVDEQRAARTYERYPSVPKFHDFRRMLDQLDRQIDAVVVSTPDHTHAVASVWAMHMGKHCYCEKPLAHSVYETRVMTELAAEKKLVTQLGIQRHCWDNFAQIVKLVQSGTIGPVRQCHIWLRGYRGGGERPTETPPVPPHLKWDLWLGPAPERPYHSTYAPYGWRFWWDFGTGETGNLGCHHLDAPFQALRLTHPLTIEAEGPPVHTETTPTWMSVRCEFAARGDLPPLLLAWHHGRKPVGVLPEAELAKLNQGIVFVGEKGLLVADLFHWRLLPESRFAEIRRPAAPAAQAAGFSVEPASLPHYHEWVTACKTGSPTSCPFSYGGPLTELVLLGNVAYRTGEKLTWDASNLRAVNCPQADRFFRREYRAGWTLEANRG